MKVRLLKDQLLVEPVERKDQLVTEEKTDSGLVLKMEEKKALLLWGKVLGVGPGMIDRYNSRMDVEVELGDIVGYRDYTGRPVYVDGQKLIVVEESELEIAFSE